MKWSCYLQYLLFKWRLKITWLKGCMPAGFEGSKWFILRLSHDKSNRHNIYLDFIEGRIMYLKLKIWYPYNVNNLWYLYTYILLSMGSENKVLTFNWTFSVLWAVIIWHISGNKYCKGYLNWQNKPLYYNKR